jgi:hypothetical protein
MSHSDSENADALRLIDQSAEPVKQITGFAKHHRIPTTHNAGDQRFVADLTFQEIDNDLQATFRSLRQAYGLKRKEIQVHGPADGMGVITTPFFNYEFHANQAEDDPGSVIWQRLITAIVEPARVFAGPFEEVFGQRFNEMEIAVNDALDLESIVDHIEDCEPTNLRIDYDKDLTWCEIQTTESGVTIVVKPDSLHIVSRNEISPKNLLDAFLKVQQDFITTMNLSGIPFLAQ